MAAASALVALAACAGEAGNEGEWGAGSGPDFCQAGRRSETLAFWITLREPTASSALSVRGPAFEGIAPESEQPGYTLEIDGALVRARTLGAPAREDNPGLDFLFNPRPLLRRHPEGFEAVVLKEGREIHRTRIAGPEAAEAIDETLACDRRLRFGTPPPASKASPPQPEPEPKVPDSIMQE